MIERPDRIKKFAAEIRNVQLRLGAGDQTSFFDAITEGIVRAGLTPEEYAKEQSEYEEQLKSLVEKGYLQEKFAQRKMEEFNQNPASELYGTYSSLSEESVENLLSVFIRIVEVAEKTGYLADNLTPILNMLTEVNKNIRSDILITSLNISDLMTGNHIRQNLGLNYDQAELDSISRKKETNDTSRLTDEYIAETFCTSESQRIGQLKPDAECLTKFINIINKLHKDLRIDPEQDKGGRGGRA